MPDPIPKNIPLDYDPKDPNLEACINDRPFEASRVVTLTMNGAGRIKLARFRLDGPDKGKFRLTQPGKVTLTNGQTATLTVVFDPDEARTYTAEVEFSIIYTDAAGRIASVTGKLPFIGVGKDCPPVAPPGPGGGVAGGGGGAAAPDGGAAGGGVAAPAAGGGDQPGTAPPATFAGKPIDICLRFWKLPEAPDAIGAAQFDQWVADVNRIYGGSGVQFRRGAGEIEASETPNQKFDTHCFDVFVGGPKYYESTEGDTDKLGHCTPSRSRRVREILDKAGANEEFSKHGSTLGSQVVMEAGHIADAGEVPPSASTTLAHELGHAMGLGAARPLPNGRQEHLDPDDGKPITNRERLMHPGSDGTKLTDKERAIALEVAKLLKGGPGMPLCDKSREFRSAAVPQTEPGHFAGVEFRNLFDSIEVTGRTATGFPMSGKARFSLEFAVEAGAESFSEAVDYAYDGKSWRIGTGGPREDEAPALYPPEFMVQIDTRVEPGAPESAYGFRFEVPKDYFGLSHRTVGLRLAGAFAGGTPETYPHNGYAKLDLALPVFSIDLDEQSREVAAERGGVLVLKGSGWQSSTFTGQAGLALWLTRDGVSRIITLEPLPKPIPEHWAAEVTLPDDLPTGAYRFHVLAECHQCGVGTSVSGALKLV